MKACCICRIEPVLHYASRVTDRENRKEPNRNKWVRWFMFGPTCKHAEVVHKQLGFFPEKDVPDIMARWDAYVEKLFTTYTKRWTPEQRTAFRENIWPAPKPVVPTVLFADERNP